MLFGRGSEANPHLSRAGYGEAGGHAGANLKRGRPRRELGGEGERVAAGWAVAHCTEKQVGVLRIFRLFRVHTVFGLFVIFTVSHSRFQQHCGHLKVFWACRVFRAKGD